MNESAAPWRALEDPVPGTERDAAASGAEGRSRPPTWAIVSLAGAVVLIALAWWLAASAHRGTVAVDGASPALESAIGEGGASSEPRSSAPPGKELVVDVQGAIVRPGVFRLPAGSRVGDAIAAAGGYGPRVAAERVGRELNLAALLRDGDQIIVPSRDESPGLTAPSTGGSSSGPGPAAGPVDLNRATASELDALPGIGPVTANKIIAAREEQPFASVDELRARKVVGAATFDKIKDLVVVR